MRLLIDENLALIEYFFADKHTLKVHYGREFSAKLLAEYKPDALLVRSITPVNESLLIGSTVGFVGSATIGVDHVDLNYLKERHIQFAHAPGCNAQAVAEYVITAILTLKPEYVSAGQAFCLGVVGYGNVGKRLVALAHALNWRVIICDPLAKIADTETTGNLAQLLQVADAVSLHVPLVFEGSYATHHLLNNVAFECMKPSAMLINTSRGSVVSEAALLQDLQYTKRAVVLDVFEHEPNVSKTLLDKLALATPHIAGYSLEGKANGTFMLYEALCAFLGEVPHKTLEGQLPRVPELFDGEVPLAAQLDEILPRIYNIQHDDAALRATVHENGADALAFDQLRKHYALRREWSAYGYQPTAR